MIPFTKAHACGNDFLIVTEEAAAGRDWADLTRHLCARNTGIGADGIEFFAWINKVSEKKPASAASACTTPTAPSPKSAATAPAAWPHGWPMRLARSPATSFPSKPTPGCAFAVSMRVHDTTGYSVEVTSGMGVPTVREAKVIKLANGQEIVRNGCLHRQSAFRHRRR